MFFHGRGTPVGGILVALGSRFTPGNKKTTGVPRRNLRYSLLVTTLQCTSTTLPCRKARCSRHEEYRPGLEAPPLPQVRLEIRGRFKKKSATVRFLVMSFSIFSRQNTVFCARFPVSSVHALLS